MEDPVNSYGFKLALRYCKFWAMYMAMDFRRKNPHLKRYSPEVNIHEGYVKHTILMKLKQFEYEGRIKL